MSASNSEALSKQKYEASIGTHTQAVSALERAKLESQMGMSKTVGEMSRLTQSVKTAETDMKNKKSAWETAKKRVLVGVRQVCS